MLLQADSQAALESLGQAGFLGDLWVFDKIKSSNLLWGSDCSPFGDGINAACNNVPLCCEDTSQNGFLAFGCTNFLIF